MRALSLFVSCLLCLSACSTPVQVHTETRVLLQFDVSPSKRDKGQKTPPQLKTLWEGLLADIEADPASGHLLTELFSGLPITLRVAEATAPAVLGAPPPQEGALLLRVAEREPPLVMPLGPDWYRCFVQIDLARVGNLSRETPKARSELVYDGEVGALRLVVEAYLRRKLPAWSFGATPRRTTIGQRVEAYKQRNAWKRTE